MFSWLCGGRETCTPVVTDLHKGNEAHQRLAANVQISKHVTFTRYLLLKCMLTGIHARPLVEMDSHFHAHTREQRAIRRPIGIDVNRNTLADFRVVATTVISGRQQ